MDFLSSTAKIYTVSSKSTFWMKKKGSLTNKLLKSDVTKQYLLVVIGNISFSNHGHSLDSCSMARLGFPRERGGGSDGNHEAIPRAASEATFGIVGSGPKAWPLHALGEWRGLTHACWPLDERERAFFFS